MNCPNCGAETNEAICPVCGMNLGNVNAEAAAAPAGENMQGNQDQTQGEAGQDMNMQQNPYEAPDMNMQQNPYGAPDMNMQQNPYGDQGMNMNGAQPQMGGYGEAPYGMPDMNGAYQQPGQVYEGKTNAGKIAGIIVGVVIVAIAAIVIILNVSGAGKGKKVVENFMDGMSEGDTDKMLEDIDPDSYDDSDVEEIAYTFELMEAWGIEMSIDYDIKSQEKVDSDFIEEMSEEIYGDSDVGIKKAYIYEVEYTMTMTYDGETESEEDTMYLVAYKLDGEWYLGGTAEVDE